MIPRERGGWWHRYVCPVHGVELEHVGLLSGAFPAGGVPCRHGCRVDSAEVRGAWTVLAHQAVAAALEDLPVEEAGELVEEYAKLYLSLDIHEGADGWMLRGRLFQQALTEAIWAVRIGEACWRTGRAPELREALAAAAAAARDELIRRGESTSNYTAWLNAAGAVCSRDPSWLHAQLAHLKEAIGPDGWEWEGSTYYHQFVLRAYLLTLRAYTDVEVPAADLARLADMAHVMNVLHAPDGPLPALHDGPYQRQPYDEELAELAVLSAGLPTKPVEPVTVFGTAGYAVLKSPGLRAIVDFGPHGGSHGHLDKLALYLYGDETPFQPDPGQVPYGHPVWREHYASTAAHPTFRIDALEQAKCSGRLVSHDADGVEVACDDAYPGVRATRRLRFNADRLVDELTVECDRPRTVTSQFRPAVTLEVRSLDGVTHTTWGTELHGVHEADVPAWFSARPGPGPADDPQRVCTWVDWVAHDVTSVTFRSTYRVGE